MQTKIMHRLKLKETFRTQFKRELRRRHKRGSSIERTFGVVWERMLETIRLREDEQSELYEELIAWAKGLLAKPSLGELAERGRFELPVGY